MCNHLVTLYTWVCEREGLNLYLSRVIMGWAPPGIEHLQIQQCWLPGKASQVPDQPPQKKVKAVTKTFELLT